MTLPPLYREGLEQRALLGPDRLNSYKLGLIEAILKEALTAQDTADAETLRSRLRAALDVALWEMPRPRTDDGGAPSA